MLRSIGFKSKSCAALRGAVAGCVNPHADRIPYAADASRKENSRATARRQTALIAVQMPFLIEHQAVIGPGDHWSSVVSIAMLNIPAHRLNLFCIQRRLGVRF